MANITIDPAGAISQIQVSGTAYAGIAKLNLTGSAITAVGVNGSQPDQLDITLTAGSGGGGSNYQTVQLATVAQTQQPIINFNSAAFGATNDNVNTRTNVTIASSPSNSATLVGTGRTLTAGTGLTGGGDLSADRTFAVSYGTSAGTATQGNDTRVVNAVQTSRLVSAGTGLTGGGDLSADRSLAVSYGTSAGTSTQGNDSRVVNAVQTSLTLTAGTGLTGGGDLSTNRSFAVAYGTSAGTATQGNDTRVVNAVQTSRVLTAGTGLTGGGDLSVDRTFAVSYGATSTTAAAGNDSRLTRTTVRAATTAALAANTFAANALTATGNGALAAQDGVTLVANDRLLVWQEATGANNGLYLVTQVGDGSHPYILTRTADFNTSALALPMMTVGVSEGTIYGGRDITLTTAAPITLNTTALVFSASKARNASTGSTTISAGATVTLSTLTRLTGETFEMSAFCTNAIAGIQMSPGSATPSGTDSVSYWTEATANANEVAFRARNNNQSASRSIDWKLRGTIS